MCFSLSASSSCRFLSIMAPREGTLPCICAGRVGSRFRAATSGLSSSALPHLYQPPFHWHKMYVSDRRKPPERDGCTYLSHGPPSSRSLGENYSSSAARVSHSVVHFSDRHLRECGGCHCCLVLLSSCSKCGLGMSDKAGYLEINGRF